jgi:parallel beta-helix repeat protein
VQWIISEDGAVVDGYDVTGDITIKAKNVTIRNCRARSISADYSFDTTGLTIDHCTVIGYEDSGTGGVGMVYAHNGSVTNCNISGCENGIWLQSDNVTIQGNYIHDLGNPANEDPHTDGIQVAEGEATGCTIKGNYIDVSHSFRKAPSGGVEEWGANSAFFSKSLTNFLIEGNYFNGGSYTVYLEFDATGNTVTDNVFGPSRAYGALLVTSETFLADNTFTGNTNESNGSPISL